MGPVTINVLICLQHAKYGNLMKYSKPSVMGRFDRGTYDWMKYMIGEHFFKDEQSTEDTRDDFGDDLEQLPYEVVQRFEVKSWLMTLLILIHSLTCV